MNRADSTKVSFCKLCGPIAIDGILDEHAWDKPIRKVSLHNTVDGATTRWRTKVAVTRSNTTLYFGFSCEDPKTKERESSDSVEIFLDPYHDHNSYYHLKISMDGEVTDPFFEDNGEQGKHGWASHCEVAAQHYVHGPFPAIKAVSGLRSTLDLGFSQAE